MNSAKQLTQQAQSQFSIFQRDQAQPIWEPITKRPNYDRLIYKGRFYQLTKNGLIAEPYELYSEALTKVVDNQLIGISLSSVLLKRLKPTETIGTYKYGFGFQRGHQVMHLYADSVESFNQWHDHLKRLCILPSFNKRHKISGKLKNSNNYYACYKCINGQQYQVRIVEKNQISNKKVIIKELQILRRVNHPLVQKLLEVYEDNYGLYVLFDCFLGRSIKSRIFDYAHLSEKQLAEVCYKMLCALNHIHQKGIIHKDIRIENIILPNENVLTDIIIANFSSAEHKEKCKVKKMLCPGFMAPELFTNKPYDEKIDIFAMGIIFYAMFYSRYPFEGKDFRETQLLNEACDIYFDTSKKSASAVDLLQSMLHKDPLQRIGAQQAMKHHWFINSKIKEPTRNHLGPPSLSTIVEKSEMDGSFLDNQMLRQRTFSKFRARSLDTVYCIDASECEFVPLADKIEVLNGISFKPSKANHIQHQNVQ